MSRYETVKNLLETKQINTLPEIFSHVTYQEVADDLGMDVNRLNEVIADPKDMLLAEIFDLAHLIGCSEKLLVDVAANQFMQGQSK